MSEGETEDFVKRLRTLFNSIYELEIPTLALIDGFCLGGGLEMTLNCDFRVITNNTTLGLPETALAIIPGWFNKSNRNTDVKSINRSFKG